MFIYVNHFLTNLSIADDSTKPICFMLKVGPDTDLFREMTESHDIFGTESGMYSEVVPEMEQIFADAGVNVKFGARSYTLPTNQPYVLLENLKEKDFRNANRLEGLDMDHTKCVLKKMAQWHAASAVRIATKGMYPDVYNDGYVRPKSYDFIKSMFESSTKILFACIREYSNSDMYYDKVVKMHDSVGEKVFQTADHKHDEGFKVLNHGDAWVNNIMFQYNEETGEILDTYFVDYQIPRCTTPAQDLLYFIFSSTQLEIKLEKFDYLLAFYHRHLEENLKLLKYPKNIPTLRDIHLMIYKDGIWAYSTVANLLATVLCDPSDNANFDNLIGDSDAGLNFKKQMFSNPRYRKHMEAILPWLLNRGLLE
ncbi:uncharacterized protein [Musca autumnalis]|uniref:uncharacterized protein n=1 Tax=Musca autumnalis TaxID=221902 RepID=UPI003CE93BC3